MLKGMQDLKRLHNAGWAVAEIEKISDGKAEVLLVRRKQKERILVEKSPEFLCKVLGASGYVEYYHDGISRVKAYHEVWTTPDMFKN